jgi:PAS domain S-box-containing protein
METPILTAESSKNNYFSALFEHAAIGILIANHKGEIILANQFIQKIFGYTPDELIGQTVEFLLPENLHNIHKEHREYYHNHPRMRAMGDGYDLQAKRKDNSLFPVEVSLSYFEQKEQRYVIAFINDISYKKGIEKELLRQKEVIEDMNANLEEEIQNRTSALIETLSKLKESKKNLEESLSKEKELNELKSRFVSMASHEFKTPLSSILSSINLLSKYTTTQEQPNRDKHIIRIERAVKHLNSILDEFLSAGKLEEGKIETKYSYFNWQELLDTITEENKTLTKKNQQISTHYKGDTMIFLDKSMLRHIINNILSNAIKFSPEGSTIFINAVRNHEVFKVSIKDEGMGISKNDQKYLFNIFFRTENVSNIEGTGLGLYIVNKFTDLMGGTIELESEVEKGTTVSVSFPMND